MVNEFENQLQNQQAWIASLKWITPSIAVQESLNQSAGSSTENYENYREQVVAFAGIWREHLMPFLYNNREFTQMDHSELPAFQFEHRNYSYSVVVIVLLALSGGLFCLGFLISNSLLKEGIIGTN